MAVDKGQRSAWNDRITELLVTHFPLTRAVVVTGYWPFKGEFDPRFAMHAWRRQGARTALPCVVQKAAALQFRDWWPGMPTRPGVYDLPMPVDGAVVQPEVVLMPPVGFDNQAYRLGYGGGFYDRTLAALSPAPLKIGVGFDLSRMQTIRPQPHDISMDFMVTQSGVYLPTSSGLTLASDAHAVRERLLRLRQARGAP